MDFSWEGALVECDTEQTLKSAAEEAVLDVRFVGPIGAYSVGEVISVPLRYLKEET
jgi:hypothetical protein